MFNKDDKIKIEQLSELFIKEFRCLKYFSLEIKPEKKFNLNILVGKNGSGKSTLLDALYEIGSNNVPTSKIQFYIKNQNEEIVFGNRTEENLETPNIKNDPKVKLWNKVIRFYTGSSERCLEPNDNVENIGITFQGSELKWVLSAIFLSGAWKNPNNKTLIDILKNLVFNQMTFTPIKIYIDVINSFNDEMLSSLIKNSSDIDILDKNKTRYIFDINNDIEYEKDYSFSILESIYKNDFVVDTGFWYSKNSVEIKSNSGLLHCETLSDGELGLIRRFALILLLKELQSEEEKCLVLLDEPETHFNENWKQHFLYLLEEALKDTYHDVFIATHSAMLVTDVKKDELYYFVCQDDKIKIYPVCINTFAGNINDIGQILFELESGIGERARKIVESYLNMRNKQNLKYLDIKITGINNLLSIVGAGEWRWKLRTEANMAQKEMKNIIDKTINHIETLNQADAKIILKYLSKLCDKDLIEKIEQVAYE